MSSPLTSFTEKAIIKDYHDRVSVNAISAEIKKELYKLADEMADEIISKLEVKTAFRDSVNANGKRSFLISLIVGQKRDE